jgi:hypothetical protein
MRASTVVGLVIGIWLLVAAIVIGYPLAAGQIRVGTEPVIRRDEPQRFWAAYAVSTVLFLAVSGVAGFVLHRILP